MTTSKIVSSLSGQSTIPFKFEKGEEEEKNNHRMVLHHNEGFQKFYGNKTVFMIRGFSVIDCVIVKRGAKDYVLVLKDNTRPRRDIEVAFGESPLGPWHDISEPFTGFKSEGPTVVKVGEDYPDLLRRLRKYAIRLCPDERLQIV